jgi:glycosyltransferase involved in cell wall biosynthesis
MRVGVDGYNLSIPTGTGVATYGATLASVLAGGGHQVEGVFGLNVGGRRQTRELFFFDHFGHGQRIGAKAKRVITTSTIVNQFPRRAREVPLTSDIDRRQFGFRFPSFDALWNAPFIFEIAYARFRWLGVFTSITVPNPPDVMHWTYPLPLRMTGTKNIYTIHDLVPLRLPHTTLDDKRYYRRLIRRTLKVADHVCTVSESSRDDIHKLFKVPEAKVSNTYQSSQVPAEILANSPEDDAEMVRSTFGLDPQGYYLYFGAVDPKKNIGRIIDAYLNSRTEKKLVLVSSRSWGMDWETRMLGKGDRVYGRKLGKRVLRLEFLPRPTLFRVIRSAKAVLCPSLYEGFGLPALEAFQIGTPVISSNVSSLPEVVGDAGILVNPYKTDEIAAAIRAIDSDDELYAKLRAAGPVQAQKFTDAAYHERLMEMYRKVGAPV